MTTRLSKKVTFIETSIVALKEPHIVNFYDKCPLLVINILKNASMGNTKFMEQRFLEFDASDIIAFVLTVFSTILVIVPIIEVPSNDHSSDEIYRLRAVYTIMNSTNNNNNKIQPNQLLWAYTTLHDSNHVIYFYKKEYPTNRLLLYLVTNPYLIMKNGTVADANLAMAVANYNKGWNASEFLTDTAMAVANYNKGWNASEFLTADNYIRDSRYNFTNLQNEIWFTKRMVHLEKPLFNHSEDASCTQIHVPTNTTVCSRSDLSNITSKIDDLTQKGFISDFYNAKERVHALENPVETYVIYLNHFIIISLIAGPITYIAASRYYVKRKDSESNG
jgi:hypothetical protein